MKEQKPTVFVVDDDAAVRDSLRLLLKSVGLPVEVFESAQDFLDADRDDRPGCLVLDIRMPGMSGLELQQVVLNLVRNAIDAMAEVPEERREVVLSTHRSADGEVRVTVADQGSGLPYSSSSPTSNEATSFT